ALAVPSAAGFPTENGNTIGEITLAGSAALVLVGAFFGLAIGAIWVAVAPWLPGRGLGRALMAAPIAVAVGGFGLVDGSNVDFIVLRRDALVVAMLLGLVALIGAAVSLVDDGLDRVLPVPASGATGIAAIYGLLAAIGIVLTLPVIVGSLFGGDNPRPLVGVALLGCGAVTLASWFRRLNGTADPPAGFLVAGRLGLAALVLFGAADLIPEVRGALGVR
ncbi:MAG TPA: hypothetical protein VIV06_00640, partial [Candidatus Limnocylindrales bacterium]